MKISNYNVIISLIITLLSVNFLLSYFEHINIIGLFSEINYIYLLISFALYFTLALIRALRIKLLISGGANVRNLFATVLVNNFIAILLPFKIGELSLPVLFNKYSGIKKKEGLLMLFYLRTIDMFVVLAFLLVFALLHSNKIFLAYDVSLPLILIFLALIAMMLFKSDAILMFISDLLKKTYLELLKPAEYVGVDITKGPGVDIICPAENLTEKFGRESFDVVIATCLLEHVRNWKKSVSNFKNICKSNGIILVIAPSKWTFHEFPYDFWRYKKYFFGL
jgi:hypothetical protein